MDLRRRGVALRLALLAILVGIGWWLRPDETTHAPQPSVHSTPAEQPPMQSRSVEATSDTTAPESSSASGATFRGRVMDAVTREPVREFELKLSGAPPTAPVVRNFHADDGRFAWQGLPAGRWGVTAEANGYQRFVLGGLELVKGKTTTEWVLLLDRGHTVRGRVYDQASQAGIASATIVFREANTGRYDGNWRSRPQFKSSKDGSFVLKGVPPGSITLNVSASDYAGRELDLVVGDDTAPLEIGLASGAVIAGRLTAADGVTPIQGYAGLFRIDQDLSGYSVPTAETGEFSFRNVGPGRYKLTGQSAGSSATREFEVTDNDRIEGVVLALGVGRVIRGTITGLRPAELKLVSIWWQRPGELGLGPAFAAANERGEYELRGVKPGRVQVMADVSMRRQLSRTVDVPANADVTVDFDFPRGARLSGRVTHLGKPIARVYLSPQPAKEGKVYNYGASTSATGDYVIEDLTPGEYVIWVGEAYRSRPVQVAGDTVFDIDVPRPQLAGRVLEEGGKVPIVAAQVVVWSAETTASPIRLQDGADALGRFELAGLEPGDFMLIAYKPGYEMFRDRISYASPVADMTIELRRDVGVEIRAHDAAGRALPHVYAMEMIGERNGAYLQVNLDERGVGQIPRALAGTTLTFRAGSYVPQVIPAWDGRSLDLKFVRDKSAADEPPR
jgi:hypothetical protein